MIWGVLSALGGVGVFLVGMAMLTAGLKGLAGRKMRDVLGRFTNTPLSGAVTGALTTAAIQSSSATTVAAVGFVASGMLTFPQALGIIFGANIGTTMTGWIVATLGFKLDLGTAMLPAVFLGALLHLSGRPQLSRAGLALAGFSLLFIGIDQMKLALAAFEGVVTPTDFPSDTLLGRLELVGIGLLITLVTQSSSAGVATALAALGAGAISFPQAAAMVIGMDVGTTVTALLATVGGGTMARRTGLAHVIYNILTGVLAFFLLGPFSTLVAPLIAEGNGQIALVGFHSTFNALGVLLVLPLARPFARMIEWMVPERAGPLTRGLDPALLSAPRIATEVTVAAVDGLSTALADHLVLKLHGGPPPDALHHSRATLEAALAETQDYLGKIVVPAGAPAIAAQVAGSFHALDHLFRLLYRCDQGDRIEVLSHSGRLRRLRRLLAGGAARHARPDDPEATERMLDRLRAIMREQRKSPRDRLVTEAVHGKIPDEVAQAQITALRWLHRVSYHLWRIRVHQNAVHMSAPAVPLPEEARIDVAQD